MSYRMCLVVLLSSLVLVTACTSKPKKGENSSQAFITDITKNGSKRFSYSITRKSKDDNKGGSRPKSGERPPKRGGKNGKPKQGENGKNRETKQISDEDMRIEITNLLKLKLAETGYCRKGYIEIDYTSEPVKTEIRGECQESASASDKAKW